MGDSLTEPVREGPERPPASNGRLGPGNTPSGSPSSWPEVVNLTKRAAILALVGVLLGILMGALDNLVVLTAIGNIARDLNASNGVPFVVSSYLIAGTVATPIFGKLSDHYSRRNFFILGQAIFIAGSLLAAQSKTLNELIVFRAIQGFGSGAFFPIGLSIIAVIFDPQTRAKLTAAMSSVFGIAMVVGPVVGAYIVTSLSWQWIFYVNLPIGILSILVMVTSVDALRPKLRKKFDTIGSVLLAGWVTPFMLALVQNADSRWAWSDPRILGLMAAFIAVFVLFVVWELRTDEPVVPLRFFAKKLVAASAGVTFLRGVTFVAVSTFATILVVFVLGGTPDQVRDALYFFVVPMIVGATAGGQLMRKLPYRAITVPGMALMTFGALLLANLDTNMTLWPIRGAQGLSDNLAFDLIPIGLGVGLTFATTALSVQFAVPSKDIGAATSLITFLQNLGGAVGVSVLFSYEQFRYSGPPVPSAPSGVYCPLPPTANPPPPAACFPYYNALSALRVPTAHAYIDTFQLAFVLALLALIFAFFMVGRMPQGKPTESLGAAPTEAPAPSATGAL
ncbi:MAG: MFS transporter [Euryarchaeota archaeon]|nr:MFS transporter [Euryarchaeota archaeon]MDE1835544.1 MFS transporter [Euryarchaeota archaeon]MDE1879635.1 MFS transporter [Euryarchaeota archaeon]MDE2043834.1 MFS transporter [Thermoplasmata archaeon]